NHPGVGSHTSGSFRVRERGCSGVEAAARPMSSRDPPIDAARVRRAFGRAATGYDTVAALQREVAARLLEQLDALGETGPARPSDLGSGPGHAARALHQRWPKAQVVALDFALPMLRRLDVRRPCGSRVLRACTRSAPTSRRCRSPTAARTCC